jgi:hypothetical protein
MNRRAMEWTARLYPAQWRRRYGTEFGALLEESGDGWGAIADVLKGALSMQLRSWNVWQFVVACSWRVTWTARLSAGCLVEEKR